MSTAAKSKLKTILNMAVRLIMSFLVLLLACILSLTVALIIISPGKPAPFRNADGSIIIGSISEKIRVNINGAEQGIIIRGRDIRSPILLFVHGGPGMPEYFLAEKYGAALENYFTVCYWEQRGGGLSYTSGMQSDNITTDVLVADTISVTNYLRNRFGRDKIYLMAHSWGTFISIQAAEKAPDLYKAYISMEQIVNTRESEKQAYRYMLEQYGSSGDTKMIQKLDSYPILDSDAAMLSYFKSMLRDQTMHALGIGTMHGMKSVFTGIFIPVFECRAYTLSEKINIWRAKAFLRNDTVLLNELFTTDISVKVPKLDIPVYFFSGSYDYTVSHSLTKQYFNELQAPAKGFYIFDSSAHTPMFEEPEKFMKIMLDDVQSGDFSLANEI
jgi:pimeloyl-ACP methyl ester carboxylesterase